MRRPRGRAIVVSTATVVAVVAGTVAATGCSAVEKALDCAQTAATVAQSVEDLQQVFSEGVENPVEAAEALERIDRNIDEIADRTDNADVDQAVEDMRKAVAEADRAVEEGRPPDFEPLSSAGRELTKVCTPG